MERRGGRSVSCHRVRSQEHMFSISGPCNRAPSLMNTATGGLLGHLMLASTCYKVVIEHEGPGIYGTRALCIPKGKRDTQTGSASIPVHPFSEYPLRVLGYYSSPAEESRRLITLSYRR